MRQAVLDCALGPARVRDDGVRVMTFEFPETFLGFQGHFPGRPIVPGVVQLIMAGLTASQTPMRLSRVGRCKFMRLLTPGLTLRVEATTKDTDQGLWASVRIMDVDEVATSVTMDLVPELESV